MSTNPRLAPELPPAPADRVTIAEWVERLIARAIWRLIAVMVFVAGATTLPFDPLAELFPPTEGAERKEFVADVRAARRVGEPIVLYQGQILDASNRRFAP